MTLGGNPRARRARRPAPGRRAGRRPPAGSWRRARRLGPAGRDEGFPRAVRRDRPQQPSRSRSGPRAVSSGSGPSARRSGCAVLERTTIMAPIDITTKPTRSTAIRTGPKWASSPNSRQSPRKRDHDVQRLHVRPPAPARSSRSRETRRKLPIVHTHHRSGATRMCATRTRGCRRRFPAPRRPRSRSPT